MKNSMLIMAVSIVFLGQGFSSATRAQIMAIAAEAILVDVPYLRDMAGCGNQGIVPARAGG